MNTNGDVIFESGVIFDNSGILCTNAHLVTYKKSGIYHKFEKFEVWFAFEEEYHQSSLFKYDIEQDIAFLEILDAKSLNLASIHLEKNKELKTGSEVYAIGNAMNQGLSITKGTVSLARVNIQYDGFIREMIQCDLTINEGDSGGVLLNAFGNMVGMPSFRLKRNGETIQGIAYCIPVNKILDCYEKTNA